MDPKSAMDAVMQRMGRAAREGKARRFSKQSPVLEVGEVTLEPKAEGGMGELRGAGAKADSPMDPLKEHGMSEQDFDDLGDLVR